MSEKKTKLRQAIKRASHDADAEGWFIPHWGDRGGNNARLLLDWKKKEEDMQNITPSVVKPWTGPTIRDSRLIDTPFPMLCHHQEARPPHLRQIEVYQKPSSTPSHPKSISTSTISTSVINY